MSEDNPTPEEKAEAEAKATALKNAEDAAKATNDSRSGKGTRIKIGSTRGRNTQVVSYEAFDEAQPDTCPKTLSEFMELSKIQDEPTIVSYLMDGFNASSLANASDPVNAFIEVSWPDAFQKQFKMVIKNYSAAAKVSIEDAVALLKPSIVAGLAPKA